MKDDRIFDSGFLICDLGKGFRIGLLLLAQEFD
jgi:hypothetical protein